MRRLGILSTLFIGMAFLAHAQTDQYKRSDGSKEPEKKVREKVGAGKSEEAEGEKLDISDIEKKYWSAKDTNFGVVQNRLHSKKGKFSGTVGLGPQISDTFSSGFGFNVAVNYYFEEHMGVELNYLAFSLGRSTATKRFIELDGTSPDYNTPKGYLGAAFNWIPIYAKLSLLDEKIVHFDMSISPGFGLMTYQHETNSDAQNTKETALALSVDIAQHFFIGDGIALRLDVKNQFYKEKIIKSKNPYNQLRNQWIGSTTVILGVTFFQ